MATQHPFLDHFKLPKNLSSASLNNRKEDEQNSFFLPENTIYLDYAASTPLDLRVFNKMEPWLFSYFGNSSNHTHPMGKLSKDALELARSTIANIFKLEQDEVFFTSSATESNNLFLRGLIEHPLQKRKKIISCATEHSSISSTIKSLAENMGARLGFEFSELPVDAQGQIIIEEAKKIIDEKTLCVCVMDVNNETGIIQTKLPEIQKLAHNVGALLHVDAVQGFTRHKLFAQGVAYDSAVVSSAKIYGPRGAAALILKKRRPRILLSAQLTGGGQENNLRSGTPNLANIVGFAEACRLQKDECEKRLELYARLENAFIEEMKNNIDACFYGLNTAKVKGIVSLSIANVNAMKLLENTVSICASTGSACKTLQATASHVLTSMGIELDQALSSFRVSFGLCNTENEVRLGARLLAQNAKALRENSATLLL